MTQYILYCMDIFFIVLEIIVVLYLLQSMLPLGPLIRGFFLMLVSPMLFPMQKLVRRSMMNTFSIDLSPYILIVAIGYLERVCSYLLTL